MYICYIFIHSDKLCHTMSYDIMIMYTLSNLVANDFFLVVNWNSIGTEH